jgi:hypothetical protein
VTTPPLEPVPSTGPSETKKVFDLLRTAKLISLLVIGPLLSGGGVVAGFAVASLARETDLVLGGLGLALATNPWWGTLFGLPVLACGILGLKDRRRGWLWAALGTLAMAIAVLAIGIVVIGTLGEVYESLGA